MWWTLINIIWNSEKLCVNDRFAKAQNICYIRKWIVMHTIQIDQDYWDRKYLNWQILLHPVLFYVSKRETCIHCSDYYLTRVQILSACHFNVLHNYWHTTKDCCLRQSSTDESEKRIVTLCTSHGCFHYK